MYKMADNLCSPGADTSRRFDDIVRYAVTLRIAKSLHDHLAVSQLRQVNVPVTVAVDLHSLVHDTPRTRRRTCHTTQNIKPWTGPSTCNSLPKRLRDSLNSASWNIFLLGVLMYTVHDTNGCMYPFMYQEWHTQNGKYHFSGPPTKPFMPALECHYGIYSY